MCRGRGRVHGEVQARADAVGALRHPGPAGHARAGRRARCGRAGDRRGDGQVRCRPPAVPSPRGGHGARQRGRRRVSGRLSSLERAHPVLRRRARQDDRRAGHVDPVRGRDHRGHVVAHGAGGPAPGEAVVRIAVSARASAAMLALAITVAEGPALAHHVGVYVPRDNEVSANFKQIKFALQARKFDVALGLFDNGALRAEMRARVADLPAGLEAATRGAIAAGDAPAAERWLMVFFAALARDLAREADRRLADPGESAAARGASGRKFLEAITRYYNLIDFAVTQQDSKAAVAVRLALDDAEGYAKDSGPRPAGAPGSTPKGTTGQPVAAPDPAKMRESLQRIAQTLSRLIETSSTSTRRIP